MFFASHFNFVSNIISRLLLWVNTVCGCVWQDFDGDELSKCIKKLISIDREWVPRSDKCSLYIRPTMIATEVSISRNIRSLCYLQAHAVAVLLAVTDVDWPVQRLFSWFISPSLYITSELAPKNCVCVPVPLVHINSCTCLYTVGVPRPILSTSRRSVDILAQSLWAFQHLGFLHWSFGYITALSFVDFFIYSNKQTIFINACIDG